MEKDFEKQVTGAMKALVNAELRKQRYAIYKLIQDRINARHRILDNPTSEEIRSHLNGEKFDKHINLRRRLRIKNIEDYEIMGAIMELSQK